MTEFTWTAVILGLVMAVVLGAANAYLGLKAGQTIAATYPAAVIAMAVLKLKRGSILEENLARTAGSIRRVGGGGAGFTIPAFVMSGRGSTSPPGGVLEIDSLDDRRKRPRRIVCITRAEGDGRGPNPTFP